MVGLKYRNARFGIVRMTDRQLERHNDTVAFISRKGILVFAAFRVFDAIIDNAVASALRVGVITRRMHRQMQGMRPFASFLIAPLQCVVAARCIRLAIPDDAVPYLCDRIRIIRTYQRFNEQRSILMGFHFHDGSNLRRAQLPFPSHLAFRITEGHYRRKSIAGHQCHGQRTERRVGQIGHGSRQVLRLDTDIIASALDRQHGRIGDTRRPVCRRTGRSQRNCLCRTDNQHDEHRHQALYIIRYFSVFSHCIHTYALT